MQLNPEQHHVTAIVLAGDRTKEDALINESPVGAKAMTLMAALVIAAIIGRNGDAGIFQGQ